MSRARPFLVLLCAFALLQAPGMAGARATQPAALSAGPARAAQAETAIAPRRLDDILPPAPSVVHLWATWCTPCRRELPELARFRQTLPAGLEERMIVISVDTRQPEDVRQFLDTELGLPDFRTDLIDAAEAGRRFRITGYPVTLFLDAGGAEVLRISGAAAWQDGDFRSRVIGHLAGDASRP
ncbi:thiol-disulfide isomerase/thioredoxin [Hoeflea marina]|uniref:Thiol-disulfide isomerase/thioredoxin n=1 Tax=Hoeflea marina TaxID=274592 RepID=A0A317PHU7_9HYPH|nr:TlpA disulfide reductase family protein [Hoeflea marina]PWV98777.1 thiol-disulfide isomerase/thioredoxin [Hoeflea marina]